MAVEPFVYLALFLLVAVVSLVFRWLKAQIEEPPTDRLEPGPWTMPERPARVVSATAPAATTPAARPSPRSPSADRSPVRRRPPAHLAARGSVRDLRRGIVWMAILGRCRGLDQPGEIGRRAGEEVVPEARRRQP